MTKETVQLDQGKLLDRLEHLEQQLARVARAQGRGFATALRAFTLGVLVGGGLALLYAPQRGEETRQRVLQLTEHAAQRASQAKEQATQVAGQAQQAASQLKDQAQSSTVRPPTDVPIGSPQWQQPSTSQHHRG